MLTSLEEAGERQAEKVEAGALQEAGHQRHSPQKTPRRLSSVFQGKEGEAEEEREAGHTARGEASKEPGCPGEGEPVLQQCQH